MDNKLEVTPIGRVKIGTSEYSSTLLYYMTDKELESVYYKEFKGAKPMMKSEFIKSVRDLVGSFVDTN